MFISKHIYFVILIINLYKCSSEISDKRLCVDDACSVPISRAKTLLRYSSPEPKILSFAPNEDVVIYSKEAGSITNLWGAEINGRRGYVPKDHVKEYKIFNKNIKLVEGEKTDKPQVPNSSKDDVKPDKPLKTFEIIDGTKFYTDSLEEVDFQDNVSFPDEHAKPMKNTIPSDQNIDNKTPKENDSNNPSFLIKGNLNTNDFIPFSLNINDADLSDLIPQNKTAINEDHDNSQNHSSTENQTGNEEEITEETITKEAALDKFSVENKSTDEKVGDQLSVTDGKFQEEILDPKLLFKMTSTEKEIHEKLLGDQEDKKREEIFPNEEISELKHPFEISSEEQTIFKENQIEKKHFPTEIKSVDTLSEHINVTKSNPLDSLPSLSNKITTDDNIAKNELNDVAFELSELKPNEKSEVSNVQSNAEGISKGEGSSSVETQFLYNGQVDFSKEDEQIKDNSQEVTSNTPRSDESSNLFEHPPTIFPIVTAMGGNLLNPTQAPSETQETENKLVENVVNENDINANDAFEPDSNVKHDKNSSPSNFENLNTEHEPANELESSQEDESIEVPLNDFLPGRGSQITNEDNTILNESDIETSIEAEDKYLMQPRSENDQEIQKNNEQAIVDEIVFDDGVTENTVSKINDNSIENSKGIFSFFTKFFDWSNSNDNSAVDSLHPNNLKCDANDGVVSYDFYSFSFNSNMMMHLVTTVIIFITFLVFYVSVNKYRIESPLVAKINQLEKDLLISIKEKESLSVKGISNSQASFSHSDKIYELNQNLEKISSEKEDIEIELNQLRKELGKKDDQIENLEKELETSTEVGLELNRLISEMLDPSSNGSEKLKENVEQFQRQLLEQTEVIKNVTSRLNAKEVENVELLLELEETKKNLVSEQQTIQELVKKVTNIEKEKETQQIALQDEIRVYQTNYNELVARTDILNNEIQILKTKLANSEHDIELKTKEFNNLKESFKDISMMKNDSKKLNSILDGISLKAEYEQMKSDIEKYTRQLQHNESERVILENKYQTLLQELDELRKKYSETDKEKMETELKLDVLNNYFKKRETELQEEVLKYKSIWEAKKGEATSTTERIKLLEEEIQNYKRQNETLKQEILSQEIALKSQISTLEKKSHDNWVNARQAERKLEDARQEAAQLRNKLTFRQRNINDELVPNGLDQNDTNVSSQSSMYSPASPALFFDNGRDQVTKSPIPGLPPFLPPPPGAPFVPPPVHNIPGMHMPPPFMPLLPPGFPGDHRPPPLGRMSSPPIKSRFSPESAFSPYERGSPSPIYDSEYGGGPYRNYSPYNSEDDRRGYRSPSPLSRSKPRASKNSIPSQNLNRSQESLDKTNSKKSNSMV